MKGQQIVVPATPNGILLVDGSKNSGALLPMAATVKNPTGGVDVALGGPGVTFANGFILSGGESISLDVVNEQLFGITNAGTQTLHVLHRFE